MKKFIAVVAMLMSVGMVANAQDETKDKNLFNHLGAGIEVGTAGIGFEVAAPVTNYVQIRAGINFFPNINAKDIKVNMSSNVMQWEGVKQDINTLNSPDVKSQLSDADRMKVENFANKYGNSTIPNDLKIDGKLSRTDFKFLVDVYPFKKSSFHVTAGFFAGKSQIIDAKTTNCGDQLEAITDFNNNFADRVITYNDLTGQQIIAFPGQIGVELGEYLIKPNGRTATALLKVNGFKPYLGIGFGRAVPQKHRLAFAFDLGAQFWGTPTIYVQNEKLDKDSSINGDGEIIKTISKITVYPCMTFRLSGRIF